MASAGASSAGGDEEAGAVGDLALSDWRSPILMYQIRKFLIEGIERGPRKNMDNEKRAGDITKLQHGAGCGGGGFSLLRSGDSNPGIRIFHPDMTIAQPRYAKTSIKTSLYPNHDFAQVIVI